MQGCSKTETAFAMALCISIRVNLIKEEFSHLNCPSAYFTIVISWDFLLKHTLRAWQKLSRRTHFLEASIKDLLLTAYVDVFTTKFYFHKFFQIFASQEIPMERLFLRDMVVLHKAHLASGRWLACCFCFVRAS